MRKEVVRKIYYKLFYSLYILVKWPTKFVFTRWSTSVKVISKQFGACIDKPDTCYGC